MSRKEKLSVLCVDGAVLNHLNQTSCKQRMHAAFNFIDNKQRTIFKRLQPTANTGEEPLCAGRLLLHKQLKMFGITAFINHPMGCGDNRFVFLSYYRLNSDIGDTEIGKQQFL